MTSLPGESESADLKEERHREIRAALAEMTRQACEDGLYDDTYEMYEAALREARKGGSYDEKVEAAMCGGEDILAGRVSTKRFATVADMINDFESEPIPQSLESKGAN